MRTPMLWQMHLAESEEKALAEVTPAFTWYFNTVLSKLPQGESVPSGYENYAEVVRTIDQAGGITVQAIRDTGAAFVGSPEGAIEAIEPLYEEMGLDELIGWFHIAENLGHEHIMNSLRLFAEQVKPRFADRPPKLPRALEEVRA